MNTQVGKTLTQLGKTAPQLGKNPTQLGKKWTQLGSDFALKCSKSKKKNGEPFSIFFSQKIYKWSYIDTTAHL
jgi:hypothetical protein